MGAMLPLTERRSEMRLPVRLHAQLADRTGGMHAALIHDISISGLRLQVGNRSVGGLLPNLPREQLNLPVETAVSFDVQVAGKTETIVARCGIAYVRRLPGDVSLIGVSFREFEPGCADALARFWQATLSSQSSGGMPVAGRVPNP